MRIAVIFYGCAGRRRPTTWHRRAARPVQSQPRRQRGKAREAMKARFEDVPLFMTPSELAQVTGEHVGSIRRGIIEGRIPADKVNGRWRICRDVVFPNASRGTSYDGGKRE